jgi:predicted nucleotidyltransferase
VKELSVIGSVARGEQRENSDIDRMVEFLPGSNIGFEYAGLMLDLTDVFGRKVDLASKKWLRPRIRAAILRDARVRYAG